MLLPEGAGAAIGTVSHLKTVYRAYFSLMFHPYAGGSHNDGVSVAYSQRFKQWSITRQIKLQTPVQTSLLRKRIGHSSCAP